MYLYTIVGAGGFGLGMIVFPDALKSMMGWPVTEPIFLGIVGSVYAAFGLLSILGLRSPLKFAPVLLLQLCYKCIWLIGILVPLSAAGRFPSYGMPFIAIFASYIIGDLIAIPFSHVFSKRSAR